MKPQINAIKPQVNVKKPQDFCFLDKDVDYLLQLSD